MRQATTTRIFCECRRSTADGTKCSEGGCKVVTLAGLKLARLFASSRGKIEAITAADGPDILRPVLARFAPGWPAWIDCDEGWWPIIAQLDRDIADIAPDYVVQQIKEKFGGLRYDYGVANGEWDERIETLIRASEKDADHTCEACGEPGRARSGGWIKTLCDAHAKPASSG